MREATDMRGVCYREGEPTTGDYDQAIFDLVAARNAIKRNDHMGCAICTDSGHSVRFCHHNPLLLARQWAKATSVWRCYHCGFIATNDAEAREHFGSTEADQASCLSPAPTTGD